ncbi:Spo0E family sporulation regulatory protein-aspartic acid phosphatase [Pasteuria penetrans]|uniref:Spo0E family sporulation regulatory protein-aspartic acid phosphatase n=1 Tax=Pasteuria penetrans TaxID=86005 RepID=UPI000FB3974B|nr:Spo0E family sporulation regulatory protein-aspartic acid phosphatase [Pasteuria penetrans]
MHGQTTFVGGSGVGMVERIADTRGVAVGLRRRLIEERMERLRGQMERTASYLGRGHPMVYELSCALDALHNEWGKLGGVCGRALPFVHWSSPLTRCACGVVCKHGVG